MIRSLALIALGVVLGGAGGVGWAAMETHRNAAQPYAGQDQRQISSLSAKDIAALEAGEGWGLAKPAELNGYPGPAHVLELAGELDFDATQDRAIRAEFASMRNEAKMLGRALIEAEAALDDVFRGGSAHPDALRASLADIEGIRTRLRESHLAAHLAIAPLLTEAQTRQYAELRGYHAGRTDHSGH